MSERDMRPFKEGFYDSFDACIELGKALEAAKGVKYHVDEPVLNGKPDRDLLVYVNGREQHWTVKQNKLDFGPTKIHPHLRVMLGEVLVIERDVPDFAAIVNEDMTCALIFNVRETKKTWDRFWWFDPRDGHMIWKLTYRCASWRGVYLPLGVATHP